MLNLLIVDDERFIADGLFEFFNLNPELDLEVYKTYSSKEALNIMSQIKIDIILSDICMPGLNGIEFHREVKKHWPRCKVIFLTGFSEFDHVQAAIRNEAFDYILKTEGDEVILNAVKKSILAIEEEIGNELQRQKSAQDLDRLIPMLQREFIHSILQGIDITEEERISKFRELKIPLNPRTPVLLIIGRIDCWPQDVKNIEKSRRHYDISHVMEGYLEQAAVTLHCTVDHSKSLWLLQPTGATQISPVGSIDRQTWQKFLSYVHGTIDDIQGSVKQLYGISASFVVSRSAYMWDNIAERYDDLSSILDRDGGLGAQFLLTDYSVTDLDFRPSELKKSEQEYNVRSYLKKINMLEIFLEEGNKVDFFAFYEAMVKTIQESKLISYELVVEVYYAISLMFLSYLNKSGLMTKLKGEIDIGKLMRASEHSSWLEVENYFCSIATLIFEQRVNEHEKGVNRSISYIKKYINEHLGEDLSLTKLSELVHFNPFYLSRLFRQVTGKSLSEYTLEARLSKAAELLKESNSRVNEIANNLGFDTPSYFTRAFKKFTTKTPQEYRDSLREQQ